MIVKSPLKEKKTRPNLRRVPDRDKKIRGRSKAGTAKSTSYGRRVDDKEKKKISLPKVKPWKMILGAVVLGGFGILYLGHVFATQQLLQEVQQLEREYNQARRMHADYKLTYDRMIGPAEIYSKAKELGFVNGGPAEKIIEVEKE